MQRADNPLAGVSLSRRKAERLDALIERLTRTLDILNALSRALPVPDIAQRNTGNLAHAVDVFCAEVAPKLATPVFPRGTDGAAITVALIQRLDLMHAIERAADKTKVRQLNLQEHKLSPIYPRAGQEE